jgi:hypothetical protein
MEKNENSILNPENIIFFYQLTTDEINQTNKQKWSITYYCLLLNAAVLGIYKILQMNEAQIFEQLILFFLAVAITFAGILYLIFTQKLLIDYHVRLRRIYKNLPDDKYILLEKLKFNHTSFNFQIANVIIPFIFVVFFECIIVVYLIFR